MSARSQFVRLATKFGMLVGAIFVVTVLLAAMPGHHAPGTQTQESRQQSSAAQSTDKQQQKMDPKMPGMDMDDAKANEAHAVQDMTPGQHAHNAHMHMTAPRPETSEDAARAKSTRICGVR
jgi:hypothetical protein